MDLTFFFVIAHGMLPWQLIFGQNMSNCPTPPSFVALAFQNVLEDRNADGRITAAMLPIHRVEIW